MKIVINTRELTPQLIEELAELWAHILRAELAAQAAQAEERRKLADLTAGMRQTTEGMRRLANEALAEAEAANKGSAAKKQKKAPAKKRRQR